MKLIARSFVLRVLLVELAVMCSSGWVFKKIPTNQPLSSKDHLDIFDGIADYKCETIGRRQALMPCGAAVLGSVLFPQRLHAKIAETSTPKKVLTYDNLLQLSSIYEVQTDSTSKASPRTNRRSADYFFRELQSKRAIFLGEHHPDSRDHLLQAALIRRLHTKGKTMAVGIEAVQRQFQPVLDDYIEGKITEQELVILTDWEKRWFWSFEVYAPIFRTCLELGVKLVALDVNSKDKILVEQGGLSSLDSSGRLRNYVHDKEGFERFGNTRAFHEYVSYTLRPPYELQQKLGQKFATSSIGTNISFANFLDRQMLRDEGMASASVQWLTKNPDGLLLVLLGINHVKFGCGVPARVARMLPGGLEATSSVLLDPSPFNTDVDLRPCDGTVVANEACLRNEIEIQNYVLQLQFTKSRGLKNVETYSSRCVNDAVSVKQVKKDSSVLAISDYMIFFPRE